MLWLTKNVVKIQHRNYSVSRNPKVVERVEEVSAAGRERFFKILRWSSAWAPHSGWRYTPLHIYPRLRETRQKVEYLGSLVNIFHKYLDSKLSRSLFWAILIQSNLDWLLSDWLLISLHNVYFVKHDVTVSFLAQVLDTVTYFVSQVLDTAS